MVVQGFEFMIPGSAVRRATDCVLESGIYQLFSSDTQHYFHIKPSVSINDLRHTIMKTRLYNFVPLKPHFYTVKLGFPGVYIIFLISAQNIDCGCSLEPPRCGGSNEYPQPMF